VGESTKAVLAVLMIFGIIAGLMAWYDDLPNSTGWSFRIVSPILAVVSLALLLKLQFRKDLAHDYLREQCKTYFNRDGFCFVPTFEVIDGHFWAVVSFQNQRDAPSVGSVGLAPPKSLFGRAPIDSFALEIPCEPGAYGIARMPVVVPAACQGKKQKLEIGAAARYPEGRGRRIRFFDGIHVRRNSSFEFGVRGAAILIAAAGGALLITRPPSLEIQFPRGISDEEPSDPAAEIITLWKLGDPPLKKADT
jgi:hypothetical protein